MERDISPETFSLKIMHLNVCNILAKQTELKEIFNGLYTWKSWLGCNPIMWNIEYTHTKPGWFPQI